ncbi:MAG: hypothetical protein AAB412_01500 [Elusimicrobiota bacterium]
MLDRIAKAVLGGLLAAALSAGGSAAQAPAPAQTYLISLSLVEALVAIDKTDLSAVFSFVPEQNAPMALATYLMGDHGALKRFLKKCRKDYDAAQGINEWDKQVLLYLVGLDASGLASSGMKKVPEGLMKKVSETSLLPGVPLEVVVQKRAL